VTAVSRVRSRTSLLVLAATLAGCARDEGRATADLLARFDAQHQEELAAFEAEQRAFPRRWPVPTETTFEGLGTLVVSERELLGRPGKAFVRVRFTYVNTTEVRHRSVRATLYVDDPQSGESWGEQLLMQMPYKYSLTPDSTYTAWIDTPTRGVESKAGWGWELVLEPGEE
jgi:hypothetical protein